MSAQILPRISVVTENAIPDLRPNGLFPSLSLIDLADVLMNAKLEQSRTKTICAAMVFRNIVTS